MSDSAAPRGLYAIGTAGLALEALVVLLAVPAVASSQRGHVSAADIGYLVLLVLWEQGTLSVRDLGEALHLDSGTLSPLLKRLEANGLVTRERSAEDERRVLVGLTAAGHDLRERAVEVPARLHEATGIDDETLATLKRACQALIEESQR